MRKNVGTFDAILRITMGLLGLAYGIGRMTQRPSRTPWLLMTLSAMKVAEGVTRYCPMLSMLSISTRKGMAPQKSNIKKDIDVTPSTTSDEPESKPNHMFDTDMITRAFVSQLAEATNSSPKQETDEGKLPTFV